jgi:CDP-diacylglycerol--glycerol-3-phosphate 3-phosphatidyltransferase
MHKIALTDIPRILVGLRFAIAPLLLFDALDRHITPWFIIGYVVAVISDIFDGIIARRLNISTVGLRQADSWADICLYVCIAISTWLVHPQVLLDFRLPLLAAIAAQLSLFAVSLAKFGKFPSFHTYTAKVWGLSLLIATVGLFGFGYADTLWLAIVFCLINSIEEIVMTLILPTWTHDVLSIFHALDLQKSFS